MLRSLFLLLFAGCVGAEQLPKTGVVEQFELESPAVHDTFVISVRLPPEYATQPDRRFPLVMQLDANLPTFMEFDVTAGLASSLETKGTLGPVIVVGIGYRTAREAQETRSRDLPLPIGHDDFRVGWSTPGVSERSPEFYEFIRGPLMSSLEDRYRLLGPKDRAIFGHSLGGLFTLYALTRHDEAPTFGAYVSASPSLFWDHGQLFDRWERFDGPRSPVLLYVGAGQFEGPEMNGYCDAFVSRVRAESRSSLTLDAANFPTDHVGSTAPVFRAGLQFLGAHGFGGER